MVHVPREKSIVRDPSKCGVVARKHVGMLCQILLGVGDDCHSLQGTDGVARSSFDKAFAVSSNKTCLI